MNLKNNKKFSVPIFKNKNDHFEESINFDCNLENRYDTSFLNYSINITSDYLLNIINEKNASIFINVECANPLYRESFLIEEELYNSTISLKSNLSGKKIFITLIVVARKKFILKSEKLGDTFNIEKNQIIGFFPSEEYTIAKGGNIFSVKRSEHAKTISYEINDSEVIISVPNDLYLKLETLKRNSNAEKILIHALVYPALINLLWKNKIEEIEFGIVKDFIQEHVEEYDEDDIPRLADEILNNSMTLNINAIEKLLEEKYGD